MSDEPKPILDAIVLDQRKPPYGGKKPATPESRAEDRKVLRWLMGYLGRHRGLTALAYLVVVVSALMEFAILPFTKLLIDTVQVLVAPREEFARALGATALGRHFQHSEPIRVVAVSAVMLLAIKLLHVLLTFVNTYLSDVLIGKITRDIRADLFSQFISLREDYYHEHNVGEMMARFTQDLNGGVSIYTTVFFSPVIDLATLLFSAVYIVTLHPLLGTLALLFAPLYYFVVGPLSKRIQKRVSGVSEQFAAVNEDLQETLSAVKEIKAHGSEDRERAEFGGNIDRHYHASMDYNRWQRIASLAIKFITEASPIIILAAGAFLIVRGRGSVSLGTLMVVFGAVGSVLGRMSSLSNVGLAYSTGLTFARQVWKVLQEPLETRVISGNRDLAIPDALDPTVPVIEFSHVSFTYPRSGYRVSDVSFKVYPGQTVAVVGEGGSGKSTVFNILFKLYNYDQGSVKLFGQELRGLSLASVRRAVGFMTQFPFFFQRSFRENLLYGVDGRDPATEQRMRSLCAEFGMEEVIQSMPQGYDSVITNRGASLSGSQQKRTALVRALMKDPPLLLLDEPLSGLSPEQRREVSARIRQLSKKKTILVITHDLDLIKDMDHILVFTRAERPPEEELFVGDIPIDLGDLPKDGLPKDGLPKDGLPKDGLPKDGLPKDGLPKDGFPKDGFPKDGLPKGLAKKGAAGDLPVGAGMKKGGPPKEPQQHGIVAEQGTWQELSQSGQVFRRLLAEETQKS